jgi:stromal membrane-associated protein
VKSNILSLFSTQAANPTPMMPQAQAQMGMSAGFGGMGGMGGMQPNAPITSMQGNTGTGMWGVSSGWNAPTASAASTAGGDIWGGFSSAAPAQSTAQNPLFQTQNAWAAPATTMPSAMSGANVWGTSGASTAAPGGSTGGGDLFSSPFSTTPAQKKDDAFGDLWSSFK